MSDKCIKPEDEVTITTTYGELAKVYIILGNVNGKSYGDDLWDIAKRLLDDPDQRKYNQCIQFDIELGSKIVPFIDYNSWQQSWIEYLFPQETEQEKKIHELEETIAQITKRIEELKGLNK